MGKSGIYKITNEINNKFYIGSAINFQWPCPKGSQCNCINCLKKKADRLRNWRHDKQEVYCG